MDLVMVGNRFDHKIWTVANVSVRAKKHGANTDGQQVIVEARVPEQVGDLNLFGTDALPREVHGMIFLKDALPGVAAELSRGFHGVIPIAQLRRQRLDACAEGVDVARARLRKLRVRFCGDCLAGSISGEKICFDKMLGQFG